MVTGSDVCYLIRILTLLNNTLPVICLSVKLEAAIDTTGNLLGFDLPANFKWL
jgi:hypothetical protein